jgi:insertion element IS1 protein InsB
MIVRDACPACGSTGFKKNGHIHSGQQNHQCKACGRQFVADAIDRIMAPEPRTLLEHLVRERISLRGICRAAGVSLTWPLHFMVECFAAWPDHSYVRLPNRPTDGVLLRLEAEADELWSFVRQKAHKQGLGLAMDAKTRQGVAFHVGDRRRDSVQKLWAKIPLGYREQATFHTDQYAAYQGVMPAVRHSAITKKARKTNHTETAPFPPGARAIIVFQKAG